LGSSAGAARSVKALLDNGADVNLRDNGGITALMQAVLKNHPGCIKLLLGKRANPSIKTDDGRSPILHAINDQNLDLVKQMLSVMFEVDLASDIWKEIQAAVKRLRNKDITTAIRSHESVLANTLGNHIPTPIILVNSLKDRGKNVIDCFKVFQHILKIEFYMFLTEQLINRVSWIYPTTRTSFYSIRILMMLVKLFPSYVNL